MVLSKKKILSDENLKQQLFSLYPAESIEQICSKSYEEITFKIKKNLESYTNKYLWYIEDEDFKEVISNLITEYERVARIDIDEDKFFKNRLDIFKMIIDISLKNISTKDWVEKEINRQEDKSNTNIIGFLHEKLIGKIDGWSALKVGEGTDITGTDTTIELKNKHNTTKGEDEVGIYEKLNGKLQSNPQFKKAYFARIIDTKSQDKQWNGERKIKDSLTPTNRTTYSDTSKFIIKEGKIYRKFANENIHIISGDKLYELLTGDRFAFKKLIEALPKVFKDLEYAKNFDENGELEKYLINKNFSLSSYIGYEENSYQNIDELERLVNKKSNFYIQTDNGNKSFDIDQYQFHYLVANRQIEKLILLKENKLIFIEDIQYSFYLNEEVILETDGQRERDFLRVTLKLKSNGQILFSTKILKELLI